MDVKRDGKKLKLPDPGGPSVAKDGPMIAVTGGGDGNPRDVSKPIGYDSMVVGKDEGGQLIYAPVPRVR